MMLLRALRAETLKLKRTIALKMVVIAPAVVVLLTLFVASQAPFTMIQRIQGTEWAVLSRQALRLWALLMLPLFITLETALTAGLDHGDNQWKCLLARPIARWNFYLAKLLVVLFMVAASTLVVVAGILFDGLVLPHIQPELRFAAPIPWASILGDGACVAGLTLFILVIQHWISLRWRSFPIAVSAGIVAMIVGFFSMAAAQQGGGWPQYIPWALPMLIFSRWPHHTQAAICIAGAAAFAVVVAGCIEFSRREVQ